jgi:hypothetical protein
MVVTNEQTVMVLLSAKGDIHDRQRMMAILRRLRACKTSCVKSPPQVLSFSEWDELDDFSDIT